MQPFLLSQGNFFLMIGHLEVTHKLIFTIPSVIHISLISSIQLRFNLGKPRWKQQYNDGFYPANLLMLMCLVWDFVVDEFSNSYH